MKVSRHLEQLNEAIHGRVTLGEIVHRMRHSGFGLIILFLCLPFLQPLPMAGLSTAFGAVILVLGIQLILNRSSVWIPGFIANREVSEKTGHLLLDAATKFFKFIETFVRPRWAFVAARERLIGVMIVAAAIVLMLPIPIPLSNVICAAPIALMALALLEKDGLMAVLGFLGCVFSWAFHIAVFVVGFEGVKMLFERFF